MLNELCLCLPFMHPLGEPAGLEAFANAKRLWPGHGPHDPASHWRPAKLPLAEAEAGAILRSLESQDINELERLRALARQRAHVAERRQAGELRDLENFVARENGLAPKQASDDLLAQAQINLLWAWRQEEAFLELRELASQCGERESLLLHGALELGEEAPCAAPLEASTELLPAWRKVLLSASLFIEPGMRVLAEGPMREDLLDAHEFEGAGAFSGSGGLGKIQLPLWRLLGLSRKPRSATRLDWGKELTIFARLRP